MENKWKVNSRGLLDTALMESNFDELDYNNSNDIANNSKGILQRKKVIDMNIILLRLSKTSILETYVIILLKWKFYKY